MERIEGMSIGVNLDTIRLQRGFAGLKDQLKTMDAQMKANLSSFDRGERSVEKYEITLKGLNERLGVQKQALSAAKDEMNEMIRVNGKGSKEAETAERNYLSQVAALNKLEQRINNTSQAMHELKMSQGNLSTSWGKMDALFKKTGESLTNVGQKMKDVGGQMSTSLSLPIAGAGVGILSLAKNFDDASVKMRNSLGLTEAETKKLSKVGKGIYEDGYGESLEEVTDSILEVKQNIKGLNDSDLEKVTKKSMTLAKTFDADVNEVTRAGNSLMQNYGISSEKAFDMMAAGAQNGMNFSKEMFDNMSEYTVNFKEAGFSADEMFAILANGSKKGYNLDRLNDSIKEFKDQTEGASKSYLDTMSTMSESTQKVFDKYQDGKATISDLYKSVQTELAKMKKEGASDDEINRIGIALFGTKWSDQGQGVIMSMKTINKEMENTKGTMDKMTKNVEESFGARMKGTLREAGDAFLPLGKQLLDIAEVVLPKVSSGIKVFSGWMEGLSPTVKTIGVIFAGLVAAVGPLLTVFGMFAGAIGNLMPVFSRVFGVISKAGGIMKWLRIGLAALTGPVGLVIGIISALAIGFVTLYKKSDTFRGIVNGLVAKVKDLAKGFMDYLRPAIDAVKGFFTDMTNKVKTFFTENKQIFVDAGEKLKTIFKGIWDALMFVAKPYFDFVIKFWKGLFNILGKIIPPIFSLIVDKVKNIWQGLTKIFSGALDILLGSVKFWSSLFTGNWKGVWDSVKQVLSGAVKIVKGLFQMSFLQDMLNMMRKFGSYVGGIFKKIGDFIVGVFVYFKNDTIRRFNEMRTGLSLLGQKIKDSVTGKFNEMKTALDKLVSNIVSGVRNKWTELKNTTVTRFNEIKSLATKAFSSARDTVTRTASSLYNSVKNAWNNLKNSTTKTYNSIKNFMVNLWNALKSAVLKVASALYNGVKNAWNNVKNATTNTYNSIKNFLTNMWSTTKNTVTKFAGNIKDDVVKAWNTTRNKTVEIFTNIKDKVKGVFNDLVEAAKSLPKRIGDGIKSMAGKVKDGIKSVGNKMAEQLETVVNAITQKGINVVLDKIGVGKGGKLPKLELPRYKNGTGVGGHKGGGFIAGDGGEEELIRFPDGRMILSPATDTLFYGERGTQVLNGKQTKEALGYFNILPMYNKGTEKLKKGAEIAKGWAASAWNKGKDTAKSVGDGIGDVWSYVSDPSKLMKKAWSTLNLPKFDAGGLLSSFAKKGISSIKDGAVDYVKKMLEEFMPNFGGDGSSSVASYYLDNFRVSTPFSPNKGLNDGWHSGGHKGIDLAGKTSGAAMGKVIKSLTDGIVAQVLVNNPTAGNGVRVKSGNRTYSYIHMRDTPSVKQGQKVSMGDTLGYIGSTGRSGGPHLDLKIQEDGKGYIDPLKVLKQMAANQGGGKSGSIGGSGVARWRPYIMKAAAQMNEKINEYDIVGILAQINRESTGNDKITQSAKVRDINTRNGNPARGLLQYIPQTFRSYAVKGYGDIYNGYHQLLAWFNNTKWRQNNPRG
ncbi:phage tail tape measure protein [Priestia megaterium]|uniref:phage tail tape measure protein n=1 Tax=Priestia megaterium TaxID=1404 RepID=UPI000BFD1045|nr:phage tail tape measure protein [Priestia megaterium]PGR01352.1 hypothetical protein COA23_23160 [Priestia megaterium]